MSARYQVRLRNVDEWGRTHTISLREATLHDELLHGDRIAPESLILVDGRWVPLTDHPAPVWLDLLAESAVAGVERLDAVAAERDLAKIMRYGGDRPDAERHEAVRIALFLRGHLALCEERPRAAIADLERAASRRARFSVAAASNLGVAHARAHDPEAACRALERAMAQDPGFLPARISLRNLARMLAEERAPALPGRPPWNEIATQQDAALRETTAAQIQALVDPARPFPSFRLWHVFPHARYYPGISSRLVVPPVGRQAAALLVREASRSFGGERYAEAQLLATAAPHFDPDIKPDADAVVAAAAARHEEDRLLREARLLTSWLGEFLRALEKLTLDNLDSARETLTLLTPFLDEVALTRLYQERVEHLVVGVLQDAPPASDHRRRLLLIAHQFAASARAPAFLRAAARCQADPLLARFWSAATRGELSEAEAALCQASGILDPATDPVHQQRRFLEQLGPPAP